MNKIFGIDTLQVRSDTEAAKNPEEISGVSKYYARRDKFFYRINPDRGNEGETVLNFGEFQVVLNTTLCEIEPTNARITRVDFRFDDTENDYDTGYKLNKLMILLIASLFSIDNVYESVSPVTFDRLTVRAQNKRFEAEYYNKAIQEPDSGIKARLELRSKSLNIENLDGIKNEFYLWVHKMNAAVSADNFRFVLDRQTKELINKFQVEFGGDKNYLDKFIYANRDDIFSVRQITGLLEAIGGYKYVYKKALRLKTANDVKFVCYNDLKKYVSLIKGKGITYFKT